MINAKNEEFYRNRVMNNGVIRAAQKHETFMANASDTQAHDYSMNVPSVHLNTKNINR